LKKDGYGYVRLEDDAEEKMVMPKWSHKMPDWTVMMADGSTMSGLHMMEDWTVMSDDTICMKTMHLTFSKLFKNTSLFSRI